MKYAAVFFTRERLIAYGVPVAVILLAVSLIYVYLDPAPPKQFVISTGEKGSNYYDFGKQYAETIEKEGVKVVVRESEGAWDNLGRLVFPTSNVDVAFVQDGVGSRKDYPGLTSLGSMFYEPIWIFYRATGKAEYTRLIHLKGKTIRVGKEGGEMLTMALNLLKAGGVTDKNATLKQMTEAEAADGLRTGAIDAAFFMGTADNEHMSRLFHDPHLRLMSLDQAEGITKQIRYLHHLVLPHGAIDLANNIPDTDIHLVAPTATLVARPSFHPALVYLLLKAAQHVHRGPGMFEARHEFPMDKEFVFPLNAGAKNFYRSGAPFWLRYLPFWLATLVERFIFLIIPLLALGLPILRSIPKFLQWRVRSKIYQRYGELKHLESKIRQEAGGAAPQTRGSPARERYQHYLEQLDSIEDRVSHMKVPLDFSDYVYSLRGHIQYVRDRLEHLMRGDRSMEA